MEFGNKYNIYYHRNHYDNCKMKTEKLVETFEADGPEAALEKFFDSLQQQKQSSTRELFSRTPVGGWLYDFNGYVIGSIHIVAVAEEFMVLKEQPQGFVRVDKTEVPA